MSNYEHLTKTLSSALPPWLHLIVCQERAVTEVPTHQFQKYSPQTIVRVLRGSRCTTKQSLLEGLARELEFPPYFGHNWDALDECLADLEDWMPATAYILLFLEADELLADSQEDFKILLDILQTAALRWASRRPPVPFHTVLQCSPDEKDRMLSRMRATGVLFSLWDYTKGGTQ
jgi:RNAse (barnase) inhibitor barstar